MSPFSLTCAIEMDGKLWNDHRIIIEIDDFGFAFAFLVEHDDPSGHG